MVRKKQTTDLASCNTSRLIELANQGNSKALELLRTRYNEKPEQARIYGCLAYSARESRLKQLIGDKLQGTTLSVREKMQELEKQIAGDNPTPLERLLAERIAMCWLDVQDHEHHYSQLGDAPLSKYEWHSQMLDRAHNRYLSAITALAKIRKLGVPVVQVNIADKQINMTGPLSND